jgi:hypothetical protein
MFSGPSALLSASKKIKNKFWQNFFYSISNLQKEAHYAYPETFYLFPIFNNPLFKHGRNCIKNLEFGNPTHKIRQIADFFKTNAHLAPLNEINSKFGTRMTQEQLDRIHNAIFSGLNALNLNIGIYVIGTTNPVSQPSYKLRAGM